MGGRSFNITSSAFLDTQVEMGLETSLLAQEVRWESSLLGLKVRLGTYLLWQKLQKRKHLSSIGRSSQNVWQKKKCSKNHGIQTSQDLRKDK